MTESGTRDWPRPVVHWVIEAVDVDAQRDFYRAMFSWTISDGPIAMIDAGVGGPEPGPAGHIQGAERPAMSIWVQVRNLRESLDRAVRLGGEATMEPFDLPDGPTIAAINDPEGNAVGLVQQ